MIDWHSLNFHIFIGNLVLELNYIDLSISVLNILLVVVS